jgi:hypothetical protein
MDNKKFEQLIDLIINENEEQARALFHDIVVEKSREIYEGMMDDDSVEEGFAGQSADLLDEINVEERGMNEEEDSEEDFEEIDLDSEEVEDGFGEEEDLEDRVVDLEDKLDQLMAEFEEIMGGEGEEDVGDEEGGEEDFGDEEGGEEDFGDEEGGEEAMMEAIALKNVPGLYGSKIGGDNGAQTKSPGLQGSGQAGMDSKPVKFSGSSESVPTSAKAPSNAYTKGETQVKGAGSFKNAPNGTFNEKGEATPKPVKSQATGVNTNSPVAESRKTAKKRI